MSTESSQLFDAVLNLSDQQRATLAYRLLQSLKPPSVLSDIDEELEAELERRVAAYEASTTTASDWDEVAARLRETLQQRKSS